MAGSHQFTLPRQVLARLAPPVMLSRFPTASSSTPLRPSVYYPSISLVVNTMRVRALCDHLCPFLCFRPYLYRLEVRLDLYGANPAPRSKGRTSVPSSALPRFLLPSFPPSSYLPRFLLLLPHFLRPASLPPSFSSTPPSILHLPSPSRRFGSGCKSSSSYVIFI